MSARFQSTNASCIETVPSLSPVARTIRATCDHYGWNRTFIYKKLGSGELIAKKAGKRTLIVTESSDRLFEALPAQNYRSSGKTAAR